MTIMSKDDIVKEYLEAKNRMAQIKILADQNLCERSEIVEILVEAGAEVPKQCLPKKAAPKAPENKAAGKDFTESLKLAALEAIKNMMPPEHCTGDEALIFISKIYAIFGFMEAVNKEA